MILLLSARRLHQLGVTLCCVSGLALLVFFGSGQSRAPLAGSDWSAAGDIVYQVATPRRVIALTFDDGPHPRNTEAIMDILALYDARATFFLVGKQVERFPDVARALSAAGHEIGNHTFNHVSLRDKDVQRIQSEMAAAARSIHAVTGQEPRVFRPPGGYVSDAVVQTALDLGYKVILWSRDQDSRDWSRPGAGTIVRRVVQGASPGDIVLLHDGGRRREQTVAALPYILQHLSDQGYQFVTVTELLQLSPAPHRRPATGNRTHPATPNAPRR